MNVILSEADISTLKEYYNNDTTDNVYNKRTPDGTKNNHQEMTTPLFTTRSTSPPNVSAMELDQFESSLSLTKFTTTLITQHYSNQSSLKIRHYIHFLLPILISAPHRAIQTTNAATVKNQINH